jgi:hypothetical protein
MPNDIKRIKKDGCNIHPFHQINFIGIPDSAPLSGRFAKRW